MKKFDEIDKNFAFKNELTRKDVVFYDILEEPFQIHGLIYPENENDVFHRLPYELVDDISESIQILNKHTAGGRVRFATDSDYIAIRIEYEEVANGSNMSPTANSGLDLFVEKDGVQILSGVFSVPYNVTKEGFFSEKFIDGDGIKNFTLNLPSYNGFKKLYIILSDKAKVLPSKDYDLSLPIIYYGSSITQGACASRPGNSYENIISRRLDCDYINLGFSGNALGEESVAEYIANQKMSVFVYDYDHNAPSPEHLEKTHERMFKIIREKNPDLPIVCITRPVYYKDIENAKIRRKIIKATVDNAISRNDKNVYFIDGKSFGEEAGLGYEIFADECHPNDLGFFYMANVIERVLRKILF